MTMKFNINQFRTSCYDAQVYYGTKDTFEQAWNDCDRGDWMLWIAAKLKIDKRTLFLAKARCAKTVLHLMKDERSRKAVEVAEKYGLGQCESKELQSAAAAAAYAAYAADAAADADAVDAAVAAAAAAAAAVAAVAAVDADAAAAVAADADAAAAVARKTNQQQTSDICREILTNEVFKKVKEYKL